MVNFNASASSHPLACANIVSYTMTFGDGSNAVTQASPLFTHTYNNAGDYTARLTVTDSIGQVSTNSAQVGISVASAGPPQLTGVVSQMTHGTVGTFEVQLFPLINGKRGVECRSSASLGAGNYTIVFGFANPLTSVTGASVIGTGSVSSSMINSANPQQYIVNLTGVANQQYITVNLTGAHDSIGHSGDIPGPQMGVLIGDTTASGLVNSSDIAQTQSQSGQVVTASNFREDVTVNGSINSSDIAFVQSKSGTGLPSSP
jgi:PKD repeat protein